MTAPYVAPSRGCAYEEEPVRYELFAAAKLLNLRSPRLQHLLGDDMHLLDEDEDAIAGPVILEIPRKYLIEANPRHFPLPTAGQQAIPALAPTLDDRLRLPQGRS